VCAVGAAQIISDRGDFILFGSKSRGRLELMHWLSLGELEIY